MMPQKRKKIGKFIVLPDQELGRGSFSRAYKAYHQNDISKLFACKVIDKRQQLGNRDYFIKRVREEYKALQSVKHENIVRFEDYEETNNNIYMFFEYCDDNLQKYILKGQFDKPNHAEICKFTRQIIPACRYFSELGILHRDIKPANILLSNKSIKLADFGLAKLIANQGEEKTFTFAGTPYYMAPEIMKETFKLKEIRKCDIWSAGVTLYELATGKLPFNINKKDLSDAKIIDLIKNNTSPIKIQICPLIEQLVTKMLVLEPENRISFEQAYQIIMQFEYSGTSEGCIQKQE